MGGVTVTGGGGSVRVVKKCEILREVSNMYRGYGGHEGSVPLGKCERC